MWRAALRCLVLIAVAAPAMAVLVARAQSDPEVMLKAAIDREVMDGDIKGAIAAYQQVFAAAGGKGAVAAQALLREAEARQKLGDPGARRVYEQIARDYPERPEAATARARVGAGSGANQTRGDRAVWTGPKVDLFGHVSPDGRFISYTDWRAGGPLAVRDLQSNTDRVLTGHGARPAGDPNGGEAQWSAVSPDGQLIAYAWFGAGDPEVRILPVTATPAERPRTLLTFSDRAPGVRDWSPDGRLLAIGGEGRDGTVQISVVSVADGSKRDLRTIPVWLGSDAMLTMAFSRDSRYLAYDFPGSDEDMRLREIAIIAVDGSREVRGVENAADDRVAGWSADGRHLLFTSTRTVARSLWALPVMDGRPAGQAQLVRPDIGPGLSLGVTDGGVLHFHKYVSDRDVRIAPIDLNAGTLGEPVPFKRGLLPDPLTPQWSPDGKFLAYLFRGGEDGLAIRSVDTGEVRRVPNVRYGPGARWSRDGRSLIAALSIRGQRAIHQIDVRTGQTTELAPRGDWPRWASDPSKMYYRETGRIRERDVRTGGARDIFVHPGLHARAWEVSPDDRHVAALAAVESTSDVALLVAPVGGAQPRELLRAAAGSLLPTLSWTPDGRVILAARRTSDAAELMLIDIATGQTRRVNTAAAPGTTFEEFVLSPDGRFLAFMAGTSRREVWALENLLPRVR
jgi:Tol biopolymer transport system component